MATPPKSKIELELEGAQVAIDKAGYQVVMMLVKRRVNVPALREASALLSEADRRLKELLTNTTGR